LREGAVPAFAKPASAGEGKSAALFFISGAEKKMNKMGKESFAGPVFSRFRAPFRVAKIRFFEVF